jgi:hypothetical protein
VYAEAAEQQMGDNLRNYTPTPEQQNLYNAIGNLALELRELRVALERVELSVRK